MLGLSVIAVPTAVAVAATPDAQAPQSIGKAPAVPKTAVPAAAPAAGQALSLDVELAPRDPAALNAFVAAVSTPGSARYHHYLAKGQFASTFGPTQAAIDAVTAALRADGLTPGAVSPDGLTIPVTTTVGQAGSALHTGFAGYRLNGRTVYANTAAPQLSAAAAAAVTGIVGLDNLVQTVSHAVPSGHSIPAPSSLKANAVRPNSATPAVCSYVKQGLAGLKPPLIDTQNYWEPGSLSASSAYNTGQLYGKYGDTGSGVSVGLFELENYAPADVAAYQQCMGTNVPVTAIKVDGGPTAQVDPNTGVGIESALDIETVAGLAPGASIKVYQGPDANTAADSQVLDTYERMVTDDSVQVISTSWGSCEADLHASDPGFQTAESNIFAAAATQGQTVLAASGDSGSTGCFQNPSSPNSTALSVDDPASQPFVVSVGGTNMTLPSGA
ncbi:MAG TPA: protease pro-enzyme activation domain-containing protein, partial [Pseudonocardiaceae bacterium]|nr:protease pro-enzyme activation domain-containing protein [Pseudonocardiaceae bacterium]